MDWLESEWKKGVVSMNTLASVVADLVSGRLGFDDLVSERLTPSEAAALRDMASAFRVSPAQLAVRLRETAQAWDWPASALSGVIEASS
jgi:hypothetical protein